jgi:hypothetical protein
MYLSERYFLIILTRYVYISLLSSFLTISSQDAVLNACCTSISIRAHHLGGLPSGCPLAILMTMAIALTVDLFLMNPNCISAKPPLSSTSPTSLEFMRFSQTFAHSIYQTNGPVLGCLLLGFLGFSSNTSLVSFHLLGNSFSSKYPLNSLLKRSSSALTAILMT